MTKRDLAETGTRGRYGLRWLRTPFGIGLAVVAVMLLACAVLAPKRGCGPEYVWMRRYHGSEFRAGDPQLEAGNGPGVRELVHETLDGDRGRTVFGYAWSEQDGPRSFGTLRRWLERYVHADAALGGLIEYRQTDVTREVNGEEWAQFIRISR
ncbi:MAG: hypothetical protein K8T90_12865 [Planctomycetes bacterium]|nr:hypothetical protein [Planctomycetota bacterium]